MLFRSAAAITFLRQFNIIRYPVHGLVTSGPVGVMTCAWGDRVKAALDLRDYLTELMAVCLHYMPPPPVRYTPEVRALSGLLNLCTSHAQG